MSTEHSIGSINIALCCDENYAAYATVVILSAIANSKAPERLVFHLIANDVQVTTLARMTKEIAERGSTLQVHEATNTTFDGLPVHRFGHAVYQRILLGEYLPSEVSRVIYLDSDLLIQDDLQTLWEKELHGCPIAAVEDLSRSACETINIPRDEYFNSGVLLMDLDMWRTEGLHWKVAEYAEKNAHRLFYVDQCSLNAILHKRWIRLHPRWNAQASVHKVFKKYAEGSGYSVQQLEEAVVWPAVIHYTGKKKPWLQHLCYHPFKPEFLEILASLDWAPASHPSLSQRLKYILAVRKHFKCLSRRRQVLRLRTRLGKPVD